MMMRSCHLSGVTPATHWPVKTSGQVTLSQGAQMSPWHVTQVRAIRRLVSSPMMQLVTSLGGSGSGTGTQGPTSDNRFWTRIANTHGRSRRRDATRHQELQILLSHVLFTLIRVHFINIRKNIYLKESTNSIELVRIIWNLVNKFFKNLLPFKMIYHLKGLEN